jgi:hypothetical protein
MIKNYNQFILENYSDPKSEIYNFFMSNRSDIENKGLDFYELESQLDSILSKLSNSDVVNFLNSLNQLENTSEEEFKIKLKDILVNLSNNVLSNINENIFHNIINFFNKVKNFIMDKIYLIYGSAMTGLGAYLTLYGDLSSVGITDADISKWISGTVLLLGLIGLAYHKKKNEV